MRVAITGGVAEGKSTVLGILRDAGLVVNSADEIAREIVELQVVREEIASALRLPPEYSRADLRDRVFGDEGARYLVNAILHPLVWDRLLASDAQAIEIPLLIETAAQGCFDQVWVVTCGVETQLERLTARVGDVALARSMLASQLPTRAKLPFADVIVRTNQPLEAVKDDVLRAIGNDFRQ